MTATEDRTREIMRQALQLGRYSGLTGHMPAPYMLADLAGVSNPDTPSSDGARFLVRIHEDFCERLEGELEYGGQTLATVNRYNVARDVTAACTPVWTDDTWRVWADLALYSYWVDQLEEVGGESTIELGELSQLAAHVCEVVAEVLVGRMFDALDGGES
jgi:hypothetical protein